MRSHGENPLVAWLAETWRPSAVKTSELDFRRPLLDNYGGEKQTTRMRDGSVQASQIDFLTSCRWDCRVQLGERENC